MSPTLRQSIISLLEREEHSALQLAGALLLTPGEVESHLVHVQRSLKKRLHVRPARCRDCGYQFSRRARLDAPGRCPRCRGQRVEGPWFRVLARAGGGQPTGRRRRRGGSPGPSSPDRS